MDKGTNEQINDVNEWIYEYMIQKVSCYTSDNEEFILAMDEWMNKWMK